jgi:hypothetical protein
MTGHDGRTLSLCRRDGFLVLFSFCMQTCLHLIFLLLLLQCDGQDFTGKIRELKFHCLLFLNIPKQVFDLFSLFFFVISAELNRIRQNLEKLFSFVCFCCEAFIVAYVGRASDVERNSSHYSGFPQL